MGIENIKINIQSLPQDRLYRVSFRNSSIDRKIFKNFELNQKKDLSNNGIFEKSEAAKNFWKGIKKPFSDVYYYAKKSPAQFVTLCIAGVGLTAFSLLCPPLGYLLTGIGCYFIGSPLLKGIKNIQTANNGDDKEKAFANFGEAISYFILTFGANTVAKIIPTSKINTAVHALNKHTISFFSNATDVSSFAPKIQKILSMSGREIRNTEISYDFNS